MPYTLTSPTALAVDAACRVRAVELLRTIACVFRLDEAEATRLGLHALDDDVPAVERAWEVAAEVDAARPTTVNALLAAVPGGLPRAATLARTGLGGMRDVARLVTREAVAWPAAPARALPGVGEVPAPAAAAAGAVVAAWLGPDLPDAHAAALGRAWAALDGGEPVPDGDAVSVTRAPEVPLGRLAEVRWPAGAWARAMHAAAWAAHATGRLHAQLLAVVDATAEALEREPGTDPLRLRAALPALHGLVVADLLDDVLDDEVLGELRLGASAA